MKVIPGIDTAHFCFKSFSFLIPADVLPPIIKSSSVTATSATLSFSQPTNSLSVDMYTVTLTGTTCNGVPIRTESTTSDSVTIGSLEAGIQYFAIVTARNNNMAELEDNRTTTLTTTETGTGFKF